MSRLNKFAHSLISGYLLMGANIVYTLVSVPLALRFLSKSEFGLWALTTQIAGYIALIDLGMSGVSRILIDYKDKRDGLDYGSVIQTVGLVSLVQSLLILLAGSGLAVSIGPLLRVPVELRHEFALLNMGQCAFLAGSFVTRIFGYLLAAHQRYDVINYSQMVSFVTNLGVLWLSFARGQGIYSMLWGQLAGWVFMAMLSSAWCVRLKLFPASGCWGRPTWRRFRELFAYGRDIFLFLLGGQFINASQAVIITRLLGLETAAVWSVCTRTYSLILQVVYKLFDYSCAALAEMIVRQEFDRLRTRFKSIVVLSSSVAMVAGILFAVCNQPFVALWANGKVGWAPVNDLLLAVWLLLSVIARCHTGLVGQAKEFGFLRYLYLVEGIFFVGVSLTVVRWGGVTAMLLVSIVGTLLFSFPYGIWRTAGFFRLPWRTVAMGWPRPSLVVGITLAPVGAILWLLTRTLSPAAQLLAGAAVAVPLGILIFLRFGLDDSLREELHRLCPNRLRPWL